MCGSPATSEPFAPPASEAIGQAAAPLIASLRQQPLLIVLRPRSPQDCAPVLERLERAGLRHAEIAWSAADDWAAGCRALARRFPGLRLGAASIRTLAALEATAAAGFRYAVSPVADRRLVRRAATLGLALVPGVMTPTEVHAAMGWGCPIVKLFPAAPLGVGYWSRLREPLGGRLPFCIAAGGLGLADVSPWLGAGVDAVALGAGLPAEDPAALAALLSELKARH